MGIWKARAGSFFYFLILFCIISVPSLWAVESASIVICAETGKILHEKNADAITPPASLTKMMTLYLTFKALKAGKLTLDQNLLVSKHATMAGPSKLWLKAGSTITVRQAILAMVTKSANDASIVIAEALGKGSEAHFATLMTQQARYLGMSKTVFKNAHGLPHKPHNQTTARDMATLSCSLYRHFPEYFKFFKEPKFTYKGQVHANHNHLLGKIPGVDGIKTGFINASGFNLAASMVRNNRRIIAVVMGGESVKSRDNKMVKLLEATYLYLDGKKNSINDLLYALLPSESQATPIPKKKDPLQQAVFRPQCRPGFVRAKSVDDILERESFRADQPALKKGSRKLKLAPSKKKNKIKVSKGLTKVSCKKPHSRIRTVEPKKQPKKSSKKRKS